MSIKKSFDGYKHYVQPEKTEDAQSLFTDTELPHQMGGPTTDPLGKLFPNGIDAGMLNPQGYSLGPELDGTLGSDGSAQGPEAHPAQGAGPTITKEELATLCHEHVCPLCPEKKAADEARLRAAADLENARKRLVREKEEFTKFAAESVLADLLPALDNLGLALQHAPQDEKSKNFVVGVDMTRNILLEALKRHGLHEVGALGEPFDPALHEAVGMSNAPEIPEDHVCSLLSKGYSLNGRLLRPAKVIVCRRDTI